MDCQHTLNEKCFLPNARCAACLDVEVDKLKADLSYANYHLEENVEMIKLAKGVVEDSKKLRKTLEALRDSKLRLPSGLRRMVDEVLKGDK